MLRLTLLEEPSHLKSGIVVLRIYIQLRVSSGQITMFTTMFTNDMNSGENRHHLFKDVMLPASWGQVKG